MNEVLIKNKNMFVIESQRAPCWQIINIKNTFKKRKQEKSFVNGIYLRIRIMNMKI